MLIFCWECFVMRKFCEATSIRSPSYFWVSGCDCMYRNQLEEDKQWIIASNMLSVEKGSLDTNSLIQLVLQNSEKWSAQRNYNLCRISHCGALHLRMFHFQVVYLKSANEFSIFRMVFRNIGVALLSTSHGTSTLVEKIGQIKQANHAYGKARRLQIHKQSQKIMGTLIRVHCCQCWLNSK